MQTANRIAHFRGSENKTHTYIYLALPAIQANSDEGASRTTGIEYSVRIFDKYWRKVAGHSGHTVSSDSIYDSFSVMAHDYLLTPGQYHYSMFAEDRAGGRIGGYKGTLNVPAFETDSLTLSDLILAYHIEQSGSGVIQRNDVSIVPNASGAFDKAAPLFVYFEIYNLSQDHEGGTSYRIEYEIQLAAKPKSTLEKLLKRGDAEKSSVSISETRTGHRESAVLHTGFDSSKLVPGDYKLVVKVKDLNAGKSASAAAEFSLKSIHN